MSTHITKQTISLNEIYPTYESADPTGNSFSSGDRVFLHLKNNAPASTSASVTAVVDDPNTVEPVGGTAFNPDLTIVLGAQMEAIVGPLYGSRFGDTSNAYVNVSYDDADDILLAVYELSPPGA